jgi:hypothetical protein
VARLLLLLLLLLHTQPLDAGLFQEMAVHMEKSLADVGKMSTDLTSSRRQHVSGLRDDAPHDVKNHTKFLM